MRFSIPRDWRKSKLADIADVQTGVAKGKKNVTDPVTRPYLRVANVQDGHLDLSEIKTIEISLHEIDRFSLQVGDVLFTEGGDFDKLGRGTVWQGEIPNCVHQNHVFAVRMKNGQVLPYFLATYASSFWGRTYFLSCSKQTTNLASINSTQLKEMPLPVPPLPEQQKIVTILSTWDRAIELTEKLIAAKQKRKQALIQRFFFTDVTQRRSETPHADWRRVSIGTLIRKRVETSSDLDSFPLYSFTIENGVTAKTDRYERSFLLKDPDSNEYAIVHFGDFVVNPMNLRFGAIGRSRISAPVAVSAYYDVFYVVDSHCNANYLEYLLKSPSLMHTYETVSTGSLIEKKRVHFSEFQKIYISLPSLSVQSRFATILSQQDREIQLFARTIECLKQQKKGLMQQLLTGKVRVNVDAEAVKG
jgi:type I restriction enzyme S subunit